MKASGTLKTVGGTSGKRGMMEWNTIFKSETMKLKHYQKIKVWYNIRETMEMKRFS